MYRKTLLSGMKMCVAGIFLACIMFFALGTTNTGSLPSISPNYAAAASMNVNVMQSVHAMSIQKKGVNGNPWGYDFVRGSTIKTPPSTFCHYFHCIANFTHGKGYVVECHDATYSLSGGISGSCSHHKGNWRILYKH